MPQIVVLTGAGISAESGVPTFRDADGLWEGHNVEDVATPEAFARDRATVQRFYDARRAALLGVEPNLAHHALAELERALGERLLVITQNIDDLHERAGSRNVLHMHGELRKALCRVCEGRYQWDGALADEPACPGCGAADLRPDVVWFGEIPYAMDRIADALTQAELFVSIGTSGAVYPAAGFVQQALMYRRPHARAQPRAERGYAPVPRGAARPGRQAGPRLGAGGPGLLTRPSRWCQRRALTPPRPSAVAAR